VGARDLWSIVVTSDDPYAERKKLTFAQAEGIEPWPTQLALQEISQQFRAALWSDLKGIFERHRGYTAYGDEILELPWAIILEDAHVYHHHRLDDFPKKYRDVVAHVKTIIEHGRWSDVLGWLEYVLKHSACPPDFAKYLDKTMADCHLAYRVIDEVVICPIGSEAERKTIEQAFADVNASKLFGARDHLGKAANELSAGHFADSVRESIHAVESVVRILEPDGDFGRALSKLENRAEIHGGLKAGFKSIYGFTSDQNGIRHALLEAEAKVDETDALFMIGACAACVSYLINKAQAAGLLSSK
jgi:hypothetical protein